MFTSNFLSKSKYLFGSLLNRHETNLFRCYAKFKEENKDCRKAIVDIPPKKDEVCPGPCERRKKKKGILHKIKLKIIEGGTNFGTPFRGLRCEEKKKKEVKKGKEEVSVQIVSESPKALPAPVRKPLPLPAPRPGIQVSVLGAETTVGQYTALLLKQCPCIKKLRLYEAQCPLPNCDRDLCKVVEDLKYIDTNCNIQAFSCTCSDLERCLQNTDLVLIMDGACSMDSYEKRFTDQAAQVKQYADMIANECPKAFVIVGATPIDCMVPLVAQALSDMGWYNPRRLLGSLAVPEMRASTLAARALCLDPSYCKVPCIGGTEGQALVPLFSKAVEYFDFTRQNAEMLTETVRSSPTAVTRSDGDCVRAAELSEAHALAGLVSKVANALICADIPYLTGFCQMDPGQVVCGSRFLANLVEINGSGITKNFGLPQLSETEITLMNIAMAELSHKERLAYEWYKKYCSSSCRLDASQVNFFKPKHYERFDDCAYANI